MIDSLPQPGPNGTRFMFAVEQAMADGEPATVPPRVSLAWYAAPPGAEAASPPPLSAGQRWRLTARLKRPRIT